MARFKVGVQLHPQATSVASLLDAGAAFDAAGVDSLWVWDHFYPLYGDPDAAHFEAYTLMAALAARTNAGVVIRRHAPVVLALWGLAVAQPLLDLFGKNPEFFLVNQFSRLEIVLFGLVVALGVPALLVLADLVGQAQQLGQVGGNEEHGRALLAEVLDKAIDFDLRPDVDASRWLIEDEHLYVTGQAAPKHDFLLVSSGEKGDLPLNIGRPQAQALCDIAHNFPFLAASEQPHAAECRAIQGGEGHVFPYGAS